jgi:hypothetical protein
LETGTWVMADRSPISHLDERAGQGLRVFASGILRRYGRYAKGIS